jgi:ferredoxin
MRLVSPKERVWIKTGTAVVDRRTCLAWEHHKPCLACDEVCPYDAIDFRRQTGNPAPVPHVIEEKCAGCGYCEHFCPIQNRPAIFVKPEGQLRLAQGSYEQHGRVLGLNLSLKPKHQPAQTPSGDPPAPGPAPGFTPESETAPGFTPKSETAPGFTPESETAPGFTPE